MHFYLNAAAHLKF